MRLHYVMWVMMGVVVLSTSILYHGQQDILAHAEYIKGEAVVFKDMTPEQLSQYDLI